MSVTIKVSVYESARAELLERIRLRDQNLVAYLAAIGAILGFTFKDGGVLTGELLYLSITTVPLLCITFSSIITNHHFVIGKIGEFLTAEFCAENDIKCWDNSKIRNESANSQFPRFIAQLTLLVSPMIFVIWSLIKTWGASSGDANMRAVMMCIAFLNAISVYFVIKMNVQNLIDRHRSENSRLKHVK